MTRLYTNKRLTSLNPGVETAAAATHNGQAHFVDLTSPNTCRVCQFFERRAKDPDWGRCFKAAKLLMKDLYSVPAFPAAAKACKFFEGYDAEDLGRRGQANQETVTWGESLRRRDSYVAEGG